MDIFQTPLFEIIEFKENIEAQLDSFLKANILVKDFQVVQLQSS